MYLQYLDIHCCRCSFLDQCICDLLFFEPTDTFQPAYHIQLHLHLTFSITWGCFSLKLRILNLLFLCFEDTSHPNFASSIPQNSLSQISLLNILWVLFTITSSTGGLLLSLLRAVLLLTPKGGYRKHSYWSQVLWTVTSVTYWIFFSWLFIYTNILLIYTSSRVE